MGRRKSTNAEGTASEERILPYGEYFPNGLPKVCHWYDMDGDIYVVLGKNGERLHVLEDHWIGLDLKKGMHIVCYFSFKRKNPYDVYAPCEWNFVTSYEHDDDQAMWSAVLQQAQHEAQGEFIPIHVRD